jgi:DNA-directed RNA polymerase specialized sigma24 family protein
MLSNQELKVIFHGLTGKDKSEKIDPLTNKLVSAKSYAVFMIYKTFQPIVFKKLRYQFFRGISEDEAQDIVQEAFLKIYTTSSLPNSFEALPSWVCKLAENNALDLFKRAYRINELDEYGSSRHDPGRDDQEDEGTTSRVLSMSEEAIKNHVFISKAGSIKDFNEHVNRDVEVCMAEGMKVFGLDHPQRNIALSMLMDGGSTGDIALALGRTVSATWAYIHECKKKLSPYIRHCLELLD